MQEEFPFQFNPYVGNTSSTIHRSVSTIVCTTPISIVGSTSSNKYYVPLRPACDGVTRNISLISSFASLLLSQRRKHKPQTKHSLYLLSLEMIPYLRIVSFRLASHHHRSDFCCIYLVQVVARPGRDGWMRISPGINKISGITMYSQ